MAKVRQISKELQQKAIDELNEDVSRIPDDIQAIREWLHQKNYITARTDDQFILTFLRGSKFSLERTKEKFEAFYTLRTLLPELFKNRNPFDPEIQEVLKIGIFIQRSAAFDPQKTKKEVLVKTQFMMTDILLIEDDQMAINGIHFLVDGKDFTMAQIYPPALSMKASKYLQGGIPTRTKGFHVINLHPIFGSIYNFMVSLLSEKLKSRVFMYNKDNNKELYNNIHREDLPKEYGGDGPNVEELINFWKEKVESY